MMGTRPICIIRSPSAAGNAGLLFQSAAEGEINPRDLSRLGWIGERLRFGWDFFGGEKIYGIQLLVKEIKNSKRFLPPKIISKNPPIVEAYEEWFPFGKGDLLDLNLKSQAISIYILRALPAFIIRCTRDRFWKFDQKGKKLIEAISYNDYLILKKFNDLMMLRLPKSKRWKMLQKYVPEIIDYIPKNFDKYEKEIIHYLTRRGIMSLEEIKALNIIYTLKR